MVMTIGDEGGTLCCGAHGGPPGKHEYQLGQKKRIEVYIRTLVTVCPGWLSVGLGLKIVPSWLVPGPWVLGAGK